MWDVIIIGGGPAGLFAACRLDQSLKVLVLEKNAQLGKKLLVSGSGQCNLTHDGPIRDFFDRYNKDGRYVRRALSLFDNQALMDFFTSRGLQMTVRPDGKVFPKSMRARDVLDVLIEEIKKQGHVIRTRKAVKSLSVENDVFSVQTEGETFESTAVIVATGGFTYPSLGSSGDGQRYAETLGHGISPMKGGLSPVGVKGMKGKDLAGITLDSARVSLYRSNKKLKTYTGALLLTHQGLSGPVIIDHSRDFQKGDQLKVELDVSINDLGGKKQVINALKSHMPARLAAYVLKVSGLTGQEIFQDLPGKQKKILESNLQGLEFLIETVGLLNDSMVTCGGVGFKNVDMKTLESRLVQGLYFAGEVLDIDGESGGYNIQAAFSTGALAADSINHKTDA